MLTLLFIAFLSPISTQAYFRLNAQTTPYLVLPKTRPELRSSASSKPPTAPTLASQANAGLAGTRKEILDLVNGERTKRNLPVMKQNAKLDLAAHRHAEDMAKRKFFSHKSPDGSEPEGRISAAGYFVPPCTCAHHFSYGENIAKDQKTPRDVMKAWMNSKIHRDNILNPDFLELGVGYAGGYWVQNFGGIHRDD